MFTKKIEKKMLANTLKNIEPVIERAKKRGDTEYLAELTEYQNATWAKLKSL